MLTLSSLPEHGTSIRQKEREEANVIEAEVLNVK